MNSKKEFVEAIRKEYDPSSRRITKSLQNALKILSKDLYSSDIHFVLELIQNADDNDYERKVAPVLTFFIYSDKILIQNNEIGFTEKNVDALCQIGASTKNKSKRYIGEKGIGFKSVFRISDEPHIFSNGFNFKFKEYDETLKLGYIVPYWLDVILDYVDLNLTNIVLPLRDDIKTELSQFDEIESSILLFLHKLKRIEFHFEDETKNQKIWTKTDTNDNIEITHPDGKEHWKIVHNTIRVPDTIIEEKRKGVEETEIIFAFPLDEKGSPRLDPVQKIFAFLPVKESDFKFAIQADFLTISNREDIDKNKDWNEWLIKNFSDLFLKAIDVFKEDNILKFSFYEYIPLEKEVTDPLFKSFIDKLYEQLRNTEFVLTDSDLWAKPEDVVELEDFWIPWFKKYPELRKSAEEKLGKKFVHPIWTTSNRWQSLKEYYQIPTITREEEAQIIAGGELPSEFIENESTFIELYKYISKIIEKSPPDSLEEIKNILRTAKIFPLLGDTFGSLDAEKYQGKIYWLPEQKPIKTGLEGIVEFRIINPKYTYKPKSEQEFSDERKISVGYRNEIVRTLLEDLDIKKLDDKHILSDLQIPWLLKQKGIYDDDENFSKLYDLISILFDSYQAKRTSPDNREYLSQLSKISEVEFPSTDGNFHPLKNLLLPEELRLDPIDTIYSESGLETLNLPQKLLKISKKDTGKKDDKRETDKKTNKLLEEWRSFLILCGIKSKPKFEKISVKYLPSEFEQKDQERFVIWEEGINKKYTKNNPVNITIIDLDEPTKTIIRSSKSTQFSDLLFATWEEQFGELIQQKTRVGIEEIIPGEFFTEYIKISVKKIILKDYLWAGIAREKIPLTTIDNRAASSQTARRITGASKELLITSKYIDLVSETDIYDDYHEIYYDSLKVEKLSTADINELWGKVDTEKYGDIIRVAIECVTAEIIDSESLKLSLELFDKEEKCIRPVTDFYLGEQPSKGVPLIEKQYGDTGRELGKILNLLSKNDPPHGVFDTIFERGFGVQTINSDEELYRLMNSWSKWNETSKQFIKDDFEKSLKKHNITLHPFIIFDNPKLANLLEGIEAIVINFEITPAEIRVFKKVAIDLGLIFPEEFGELKIKADPLEIDELNEINKICDALWVFYEKDDQEVLSEKLQIIGGYENLGKKIRKNSHILRVITINEEFVIDVKLPFFDEKDQLFYVDKDLDMEDVISQLLQFFGFARKSQNMRDITKALGSGITPVPHVRWKPLTKAENIQIRFGNYDLPETNEPKPNRKGKTPPIVVPTVNLSQEDKDKIGEEGEKYAVLALLHCQKEKYPEAEIEKKSDDHYRLLNNQKKVISEIQRVNLPEYNQKGYDIEVINDGVTEYIDVKSTIDASKDFFHITDAQWKFAQENGDLFHILRVYNTGTENARIVFITNPCKQLADKKINAKFDVRLYI